MFDAELQSLAALLVALKNLEIEIGAYAEWDGSVQLRAAMDHCQMLREHLWPRWVAMGGLARQAPSE